MIFFHEIHKDYTSIYNHSLHDKTLPLNGWFHRCYICEQITSKEIDYYYKKKLFKIIVCSHCHKKFNSVKKKRLNNYIERYFT